MPTVDVLPVSVARRQVTPRNACTITIENRLDKQPVVARRNPDCLFAPRQQVLDAIPLVVS
jgi:hypothetical protein